MNDVRNLVVVCEKCHDDHHNGSVIIGSVEQTSNGPIRKITKKIKDEKSSEEKTEEKKKIEEYLRKYPSLPLSRIVFDLSEQDIQVSEARLRSIRKNLV